MHVDSHQPGEGWLDLHSVEKLGAQGGPELRLTCRIGISLSKARHSSSRRPLGHVGVQQPEAVPKGRVSDGPDLQPHQEPLQALSSQPTLPSAAQHSLPAPAKPPGQNVSSPCMPPSSQPDRHRYFFCATALGLQPHWPPFSLISWPFPCLKLFCGPPPTPTQDKNLQAMAQSGIPACLLPGSNLSSPATTCPFHLSACSHGSLPHPGMLPPFPLTILPFLSPSQPFISPAPCLHPHYPLGGAHRRCPAT